VNDEQISPASHLIIRGARQHNLKNVNLDLPKNKLIVFTGLSGSGKSSMAFDTIYAEGQRRYVESLSSYARQFLGIMDKPELDRIDGLSPAISIDQKSGSHNPRSTVGTVTEVYDYLRLLFARIGHPHCPQCGREIQTSDAEQITNNLLDLAQVHPEMVAKKGVRLLLLAPVVRHQKGQFRELLVNLRKKGYQSVRVDGRIVDLDTEISLVKTNFHTIEVVIDRLVIESKALTGNSELRLGTKNRLFEAVEQALRLAGGLVVGSVVTDPSLSFPTDPTQFEDHLFSEKFACAFCNISLPEIEPRTFSFNSPDGACPTCSGLGSKLTINPEAVLAPRLTLNQGAIIPIAGQFETDTWLARLIRQVALEHGFDAATRLNELEEEQLKVLLEGTGEREYKVSGRNSQGRDTVWTTTYPGIIAEMERRYVESSSDYVRREMERFMVKQVCPDCKGARLKPEVLSITVLGNSIAEVTNLPISRTLAWLASVKEKIASSETQIAEPILAEIHDRLTFLESVGLDYLTLGREAGTLAGGELQRIRLASQIGSRLTGILYVLDEPTIGLHERDNQRLIKTLRNLQTLGNTLIVVEHDREMMLAADEVVEFGPGAGQHGGQITYQGSVAGIKTDKESLTGGYLSGRKQISITEPHLEIKSAGQELVLSGAGGNNLKQVELKVPLNKLVGVTGVSGSGKSTLVVGTLYEALARELSRQHQQQPVIYDELRLPDKVKRVSLIDQSPIGRTPRSNPATYTKAFDYIRKLFASSKEASIRGYGPGRFSFNVKGGRCEACQGDGQNKIEMQFMADIYVTCPVCEGRRYNSPTLEVEYQGKNIAAVLDLTVDEAADFFRSVPGLAKRLKTLQEVGLGYIRLGQPAPTLSGGEAQRIKLASELAKTGVGHTIYILDEPTTGLHFADLQKLLNVLSRLVGQDNTVVVIEHNLDLIKNVDWIIDLGPEGGEKGGQIIAEGTPKQISQLEHSYTGAELKKIL
jgi:excinuclease ABC subunit A